jgi:S-adenosylmethionine decarboxylase
VQNFISSEILETHQAIDTNNYQDHLFHTKLMRTEIDLDHYLFGGNSQQKLPKKREREKVRERLSEEIQEIFYGRNFLV